jgi:hypothetical protein
MKGEPDIIYHELIVESTRTGTRVSITQEGIDRFLAQVLDINDWHRFDTLEEGIQWARQRVEKEK